MSLWDYCAERIAQTNNILPRDLCQLRGSIPHSMLHDKEDEISNICQFDWHEWIFYRANDANDRFTFPSWALKRALRTARDSGNKMCECTLKPNGKVVPRRTVHPLSTPESHSPPEVKKREVFNNVAIKILGSAMIKPSGEKIKECFIECEKEKEESRAVPGVENPTDIQRRPICQHPDHDRTTNAEVSL